MYTIYLTTDCNFKCTYCYEGYQSHLNITEEKMIDIIEFIYRNEKSNRVNVGFLGGEPLLKKEIICQAVEYIKVHYPERQTVYYMTTNGSLLDDEMIEFMQEKEFHLRISFDGTEETHNLNRRVKSGKAEYGNILENIIKIQKSKMIYSVRMTVAANAVENIFENIRFLHEHEFDNISMVLDIYMEFTEDLQDEFKKQMELVSDYYIEEFAAGRRFGIDIINGKILNMLGEFQKCFAMCGAGKTSFNIMPDGKIYPCSYLTDKESYCIGDVNGEADLSLAEKIAWERFDRESEICMGCELQGICHGMKCGYLNYVTTGAINVPSSLTCKQEKIMYPILNKVLLGLVEKKGMDITFMGSYIKFIEQDGVALSPVGEKVKQRLEELG